MEKQRIYSIRKGSVQWNEEDRLKLAGLLVKTGYAVRIGRGKVQGTETSKNVKYEYFVEYWEGDEESESCTLV